jgi:HD-GYP domain-containing protein (c-di-GMP phosphodiesterase class II)
MHQREPSSPNAIRRPPRLSGYAIRWILCVAVPSVVLGVLVQNPGLDVEWELSWAHLILMVVAGVMAITLALLSMRVAAKTHNARIIVLALAFVVMGVFLMIHGLLTPETVLPFATTGTEWTLLLGFLLCSLLLAASHFTFSRAGERVIVRLRLHMFLLALGLALLAGAVAVRYPSFLALGPSTDDGYGHISELVSAAGSLLTMGVLAVATAPYYRDYRLTGLSFSHAMVTGMLVLQVAALASLTSSVWHVRWWEYHVLLFSGLGVILVAVLREAARRSSVSEVFATLVVGDTIGKLEHSYTEVLQALVDLVEARHQATHGHSARVARLSTEIGEELGLSPEELRRLHQAALLHDVGKIVVPDTILNKPGALTPEEYALIASHATIGEQLISRISALAFARPGVRWHHERLNGSGYPDGLQHDAIPLEARIIAVADAYDAMTSPRPYRSAWSPAVALADLRERAGSEYDLAAVTALARRIERVLVHDTAAPSDAGTVRGAVLTTRWDATLAVRD